MTTVQHRSVTRPRPVLTTSVVVGAVHTVAFIAGFLGLDQTEMHLSGAADAIAVVVIAVVTLGAHVASAWKSQNEVTPLSDPKDYLGRALVVAEESGGEIRQLIGSVQELGRALTLPADGSAHGDLATPGTAAADGATPVEAPAPAAPVEPSPAPAAPVASAQ